MVRAVVTPGPGLQYVAFGDDRVEGAFRLRRRPHRPIINAAAERAERPPPRIVALVTVCVTDDPDGVRAHGRRASELYDAFPSYRRMLDREGVASGADLILAGTMDEITEGLAAYDEAGVTDLRIAITARNDDERQATRDALSAALAHRPS